ncbi:hypothetical protein MIR68_002234 [Amoeboaphelidium protococcarum]|nr:hypothetical protein MIR68_002234 [Amoeboaphelidium protococcarum]
MRLQLLSIPILYLSCCVSGGWFGRSSGSRASDTDAFSLNPGYSLNTENALGVAKQMINRVKEYPDALDSLAKLILAADTSQANYVRNVQKHWSSLVASLNSQSMPFPLLLKSVVDQSPLPDDLKFLLQSKILQQLSSLVDLLSQRDASSGDGELSLFTSTSIEYAVAQINVHLKLIKLGFFQSVIDGFIDRLLETIVADSQAKEFKFADKELIANTVKNYALAVKKLTIAYVDNGPVVIKRRMIAQLLTAGIHQETVEGMVAHMLVGTGVMLQKALQVFLGFAEQSHPSIEEVSKIMRSKVPIFNEDLLPEVFSRVFVEGDPLKSGFVEFGDEPISQGTVGIVYKAKLGESAAELYGFDEVAVKLRRSDAKELVQAEFSAIEGQLSNIHPFLAKVILSLKESVEEEFDFDLEAANLRQGYKVFENRRKNIRVTRLWGVLPVRKPWLKQQPAEAIITQWAPGVVLDKEYSAAQRELVSSSVEPVDKYCSLRLQLTSLGFTSFQSSLGGSGFYHADLHLSNMKYDQETGTLWLLDFGNAGYLRLSDRATQLSASMSMLRLNGDGMFNTLKEYAIENNAYEEASPSTWKAFRKSLNEQSKESKANIAELKLEQQRIEKLLKSARLQVSSGSSQTGTSADEDTVEQYVNQLQDIKLKILQAKSAFSSAVMSQAVSLLIPIPMWFINYSRGVALMISTIMNAQVFAQAAKCPSVDYTLTGVATFVKTYAGLGGRVFGHSIWKSITWPFRQVRNWLRNRRNKYGHANRLGPEFQQYE